MRIDLPRTTPTWRFLENLLTDSEAEMIEIDMDIEAIGDSWIMGKQMDR